MIRDFLARDFLAHRVTFRDFMARNFLARDFLGGYQKSDIDFIYKYLSFI